MCGLINSLNDATTAAADRSAAAADARVAAAEWRLQFSIAVPILCVLV